MILNDVACSADSIVVAGSSSDPDVLGHCDLDVIYVFRIPDGFVEHVGESQRKDVLNSLFTQVMVDAEHRIGWEHRLHHGVKLAGGLQVRAERFFDNDSTPFIFFRSGEPRAPQLFRYEREGVRWDRQIKRVITHRAALSV